MLRESSKFSEYNFREYAGRRVQDAFHEAKAETDSTKIKHLVTKAEENLQMIKRQTTIGEMYREPAPLVIEKRRT